MQVLQAATGGGDAVSAAMWAVWTEEQRVSFGGMQSGFDGWVEELAGRLTKLEERPAAMALQPSSSDGVGEPGVADPAGVIAIVDKRCSSIEVSLKQLDDTAVAILEETGKRISYAEEASLSRCKWLDSRLMAIETAGVSPV